MKKKLPTWALVLGVCLARAGFLFAQDIPPCGTPPPAPEQYRQMVLDLKKARVASGPLVYLPLKISVVRNAVGSGTAFSLLGLNRALFRLNQVYRSINIQFYLAGSGIQYIDNTALASEANHTGSLSVTYGARDAINLFITPNLGTSAGYAYYPATSQYSNCAIFKSQWFESEPFYALVPHELGHYFDLIHVHEFNATANSELVNGSNCTTAGDLLCDTPPDPYGLPGTSVNGSCVYTGTAKDRLGATYAPVVENIMGYWHSAAFYCQNVQRFFSPGQKERIYNGYLKRRDTPGEYTLNAAPATLGPLTLALQRNGATGVLLTWNQVAGSEGFQVEKSSDGSYWEAFAFTPPAAPGASDLGLLNKTYYRARASNSLTYSNVVSWQPLKTQEISFNAVPAQTYAPALAPLVLSGSSSAGLPVSYQVTAGPGSLANGNQVQVTGAGTLVVQAYHNGNDEYAPASVSQTVTVAKAAQSLAFAAIPGKTFGDAPFELSSSSSVAGFEVSFQVLSGPASLNGNRLSITGAGTVVLRAFNAGNDNYLAAESLQTVVVAKAAQVLTFEAIPGKTFGDAPFDLVAGSVAKLPLSFSVNGPASVSGAKLTLLGAGTVSVTARQAGNDNYLAAEATQAFVVAKAAQTIAFNVLPAKTYLDPPLSLTATSSAGLPVSYTATGPARVSGNVLTITGAGSVSVTASQGGNANYLAATDAVQAFTVAKAAQTVALDTLVGRPFTLVPLELPARSTSGLVPTFSVTGPASIELPNKLKMNGIGLVVVVATQGGNADFLPANAVTRSFTVVKADQTIAFDALPDHSFGDADFDLGASVNTGAPLTVLVTGPATVANGKVSITGAGVVSITVSQAGSENYNAAQPVTRGFTVAKRQQVLSFAEIANRVFSPAPFALAVGSNSALPVQFSVSGPASLEGSAQLRLSGTGTVSVKAAQPGDANNLAAAEVTRSFSVEKAPQTIAFNLPALSTSQATFSLSATASSGLPVQFALLSGPASLAGTTLTFSDFGKISLKITQPGDDRYLPAPDLTPAFCVNPEKPVITSDPVFELKLLSSLPFRNQWLRNGDSLRGATDRSYLVTQEGDYSVKARNPLPECNALATSDVLKILILAAEAPADQALEVLPNPASGAVLVRLAGTAAPASPEVRILNLLGMSVLRPQLMPRVDQHYETRLGLGGLPGGTYLIEVEVSGKRLARRVVLE